jgi:hypothetical protein
MLSLPRCLLLVAVPSLCVAITHRFPSKIADYDEVIEYVRKQQQDAATIRLSKAQRTAYDKTIAKVGIHSDAPEWDTKPTDLESIASGVPAFSWLDSKEDSAENRKNYMSHLNDSKNIIFPPNSKLFDATSFSDFLSADMVDFGVRIRGNIDVVLAAERHASVSTTRNNMWACIELKKDENNSHEGIERQVILQHLAASFLNENTGILTIMTDLCRRWHFYWFSDQKNALMKYEAISKGEAYYLTRHMLETDNTSTPQDFLNRASWNEMFQKKQSSTQRLDSVAEEAGEEDQDENRGTSRPGRSDEAGSSNHGRQQGNNRRTGSPGHGNSAQGNSHVMMDTLDFMDEEEEREARFREVLDYVMPRFGYFHPSGLEQAEDPPSHITVVYE